MKKVAGQWLDRLNHARSEDEEMVIIRDIMAAERADALEAAAKVVEGTPMCETYGRASGGMALGFALKGIRALAGGGKEGK